MRKVLTDKIFVAHLLLLVRRQVLDARKRTPSMLEYPVDDNACQGVAAVSCQVVGAKLEVVVRIHLPELAVEDVEMLVRKVGVHLFHVPMTWIRECWKLTTADPPYLVDIFFLVHSVERFQ
jgi:hypothetical protein